MRPAIEATSGLGHAWRFTAEPGSLYGNERVWFYLECGPMTGGLFLPAELAEQLGRQLLDAAAAARVEATKRAAPEDIEDVPV